MANDKGFSLLEAIVSIAIISASLGVMMQGLSASTKATLRVETKYRAAVLAEVNLHGVGDEVPLEASVIEGESGSYRWRIEIAPLEIAALDVGEEASSAPLFEVRSIVAWGEPGAERVVELVTAKVDRKGLRQ